MAYEIVVEDRSHLVITRHWGEFSISHFSAYLDELANLGPFDNPYQLLAVLHKDIDLSIASEDLRTCAKRLSQFSPSAKRVIVSTSPLAFGLSRLYASEATIQTDDYNVVGDMTRACEILRVQLQDLPDWILDGSDFTIPTPQSLHRLQ